MNYNPGGKQGWCIWKCRCDRGRTGHSCGYILKVVSNWCDNYLPMGWVDLKVTVAGLFLSSKYEKVNHPRGRTQLNRLFEYLLLDVANKKSCVYLYFKLFINETAQKPWPLLTCSCPFVEVFLMHGIGLVSVGAMDDLAPKLLRTKSTCGIKVQHPLFQILTRPLHWRNFCSGWLSNNVHSWFSLFIGKYERNRNTYVVVGWVSTELQKLNFWQQRPKV